MLRSRKTCSKHESPPHSQILLIGIAWNTFPGNQGDIRKSASNLLANSSCELVSFTNLSDDSSRGGSKFDIIFDA